MSSSYREAVRKFPLSHSPVSSKRYDTIRDAILMCAKKVTGVSLMYHTEPTTKKWKTEKLKSKKIGYAQKFRK